MNSKPLTLSQFYMSWAGLVVHAFFGSLTLLLTKDWLLGRGPVCDWPVLLFSVVAPPFVIICKWVVHIIGCKQHAQHTEEARTRPAQYQAERVRQRGIVLGIVTVVALALIYAAQERMFANPRQLHYLGYFLLAIVLAGLMRINIWNKNFILNPNFDIHSKDDSA